MSIVGMKPTLAPQGQTMKVAVVVPTIRRNCIHRFLEAWHSEFATCDVLVVEDNPEASFDLGEYPNVVHYAWSDIDRELGEQAWIIPRRTDCVRSFGFLKAYQREPDMIVTLDDDCMPGPEGAEGFLARHWARLEGCGEQRAWRRTGEGPATRGYPYYGLDRRWRCMLNHGMWVGVPDFDSPTAMQQSREARTFSVVNQTIPVGEYFPMCGMNLAFRPELAPAMFFLLMGQGYDYDRFGDIWAGLFVKRICDHFGYAVTSGEPVVTHLRASNVWANLRKEAPGLELNETLWQLVDSVVLTGLSVAECYQQLARALRDRDTGSDYLTRLGSAMLTWTELFEPSSDSVVSLHGARTQIAQRRVVP